MFASLFDSSYQPVVVMPWSEFAPPELANDANWFNVDTFGTPNALRPTASKEHSKAKISGEPYTETYMYTGWPHL